MQAKELVKVLVAVAKGENAGCGEAGCLAKGRTVTQDTLKDVPFIWAEDYANWTAPGAAAAVPAAVKKIRVGVSWDEKAIPLIQAWEDYMKAEAAKAGPANGLDFEFVVNVANLDPTRQAANIEDLIQQKVDIIMARAKDGTAIGASIRAASDANIPFVVFDRKSLTEEQGTAYVGGDSYDQGKVTAEGLVKVLKDQNKKGQCIEVMGDLKDNNAVLRSKAFNEVAAQSGQYTVLVQVPTEWNPELFKSGITNALQAHPEADCLFLASDFAWSSVQSALESQGRWGKKGEASHIITATCDLFPDALKAMKEGYIDVTTIWDAYMQAKELVKVLVAVAKGEDPGCGEVGCLAKGRTVTQDTLKDVPFIWAEDYANWKP
jgi:ABC-type sugar transport system substrate-binding protein